MKTKKEIKEEIKFINKTIENYRNAYKEKKIPKDVLINKLIDLNATIDTLNWVLGKNNRYD